MPYIVRFTKRGETEPEVLEFEFYAEARFLFDELPHDDDDDVDTTKPIEMISVIGQIG